MEVVPLKQNSDIAVEECSTVHSVIVVKDWGNRKSKDIWYHDLIRGQSDNCPIEQWIAKIRLYPLHQDRPET